MARVVAVVEDLMFGSRVVALLQREGHEVQLCPLAEAAERAPGADVLVVDLTVDAESRSSTIADLRAADRLPGTRALGFYSHVEAEARAAAEAAGFDLVVPRSRMAREGGELVSGLAAREA